MRVAEEVQLWMACIRRAELIRELDRLEWERSIVSANADRARREELAAVLRERQQWFPPPAMPRILPEAMAPLENERQAVARNVHRGRRPTFMDLMARAAVALASRH